MHAIRTSSLKQRETRLARNVVAMYSVELSISNCPQTLLSQLINHVKRTIPSEVKYIVKNK